MIGHQRCALHVSRPFVRVNVPKGHTVAKRQLRIATHSSSSSTVAVPEGEQAALQAFVKAYKPEGLTDCLKALKQAAHAKLVEPEAVEGALVYLEENYKQSPPIQSPEGTWRLVFGTATKIRALQYIPVREDFVIDLENKKLALESAIGPFQFHVKGPVSNWDSSTGGLLFQFDKVDIFFMGKKVYEVTPKTKPKTYTWFFQGEGIAAARSSAGGLALMRK